MYTDLHYGYQVLISATRFMEQGKAVLLGNNCFVCVSLLETNNIACCCVGSPGCALCDDDWTDVPGL